MKRIMVPKGMAALMISAITLSLVASRTQAETPRYVTAGTTPSNTQVFWHTNLKSGWAEARKRNLPMVIFITSRRCHYCDAMKRNTWCNDQVQRNMAGKFVAIELTPERNEATLKRIKIPAFPTTLLGIPSGKVIAHRVGYQPPTELRGLLAEVDQRRIR